MTAREARLPAPNSLRAWLLACRPATLWASSVPVLVGTACAKLAGGFAPLPALAALIGAGLLQIGSNFANDVFDFEQGADTDERLGPTRAVAAGLVSPRAMKRGMLLVFGLALAVGVYLTVVAGPVVVAIGVASILAAIAYTGGPYPLGYNGLGDVFVMLFFGFVAVLGTELVQAGAISHLAVLASIPVGSLATAILVVNNLRDIDTDREAGKRTLAVRFGRRATLAEYLLLNAAAYATVVLIWGLMGLSAWVLLPCVAAPLAVKNGRALWRLRGAPLNVVLVRTAQHLAIFGLLFAIGLTLSPP